MDTYKLKFIKIVYTEGYIPYNSVIILENKMIPQYIITFREAFEVLLLTIILYGYLKKTGRLEYTRYLFYGVILATISSIGLGIFAYNLYITSEVKTLFEIIGSFLAVGVLTYIVYSMAKSARTMISSLKERVESTKKLSYGLVAVGFVIAIREGVETILFLIPFFGSDTIFNTVSGSILGITSSFVLAGLIYKVGINLNIRKFFIFTSVLLIFVASGVLGYGTHELIEYMEENGVEIGTLGYYIYNMNIEKTNILHESNVIGGILSALVGYATKMELIRFAVQFGYLAFALWLYLRVALKEN